MKRYYKISCNAPGKPVRLAAAVGLGFAVMVFINGFIGGMGGLPAFLAFAFLFYLLRSVTGERNRITHQLAMTSRRELLYVFLDYSVGYLALWAVCRLGLTFSRVNGWGNISGASALEYFRGLFSTSLLEMWAYVFVGVLMFAFVLSLFPLVVIQRLSTWAAYALMDGAIFALLCELVGGIAQLGVGEKLFSRGTCLIDYLLLCGGMAGWKKALSMAGVLLFAGAVAVFSFFFASHCYGPKPGRMDVDVSAWERGELQRLPEEVRLLRQNALFGGIGVVLLAVVMAVVFFGQKGEESPMYDKVAEFLTEDGALGPMVYGGRIYIPVDEELGLYETGIPQGYLAHKGEDCDSRLYELTVADVLYTEEGGGGHVQVYGADIISFAPAEELEESEDWRKDAVFLLWDEDWVRESAYSHEPTGYAACSVSFVEALEEKFGRVAYRTQDFSDYDAYFSLCGYADMGRVAVDTASGHWVGCILVKDNRFYYGSRENEITGELLAELLDILGGYDA